MPLCMSECGLLPEGYCRKSAPLLEGTSIVGLNNEAGRKFQNRSLEDGGNLFHGPARLRRKGDRAKKPGHRTQKAKIGYWQPQEVRVLPESFSYFPGRNRRFYVLALLMPNAAPVVLRPGLWIKMVRHIADQR